LHYANFVLAKTAHGQKAAKEATGTKVIGTGGDRGPPQLFEPWV